MMEKQNKFNCARINQISFEEILQNFGLNPAKKTRNEIWYLNPFFTEKTASFKVNILQNTYYLFSDSTKGSVVDFLMRYLKTNIEGVINYSNKKFYFSSFQKQKNNEFSKNFSSEIEIISVKKIENSALLNYIKSRKILEQKDLINEINYQINDKKYFGICFKNNSGGFEVRNKYAKICLGKKDFTTIKNGSKKLRLFEGFIDYYSFINLQKSGNLLDFDYIILNSVVMVPNVLSGLKNYDKIELYFDNDHAGNRCSEIILHAEPRAKDYRFLYTGFKDLNEFLMYKKSSKSII